MEIKIFFYYKSFVHMKEDLPFILKIKESNPHAEIIIEVRDQ
ncbi:hypothetical protein [Cuneatibacter caecimuris]|uniref:Uncharacterized protein n=1 Tax=Cuneatibacter caecimuris TaxID=1796618 RepID=A0A4Q7PJQ4_9FIRM|nr:hypothetical protein [Cuneatibacter caecimuris]RZT00931.1 hypothetical protein EV209_1367 [Cuneatibacter caecimuris]